MKETDANTGPTPRVLERIRAEYLEMPGMRLKSEQVQRLCGLDQTTCQVVLDALVDAKFLCVTPDGTYTRWMDAEMPHPRPANVD